MFTSFPVRIFAEIGSNATLPCRFLSKRLNPGIRLQWTKLENDAAPFEDVLLSLGTKTKTFGRFENRVFLQAVDDRDASLVITDIAIEDAGQYRCEVINGTKHTAEEGFLKVRGCLTEGEMQEVKACVFPTFSIRELNHPIPAAFRCCLSVLSTFGPLQPELHQCHAGVSGTGCCDRQP